MKTIIALLFLALMFFSLSCKKEDLKNTQDSPLFEDTWSLINKYGGIFGYHGQFKKGEVLFQFRNQDSTLLVTNNIDPDSIELILEDGVYDFYTFSDSLYDHLYVNDVYWGVYYTREDSLIVDQRAVDGFIRIYIRCKED